jgi:hypothetical protein
MRRKVLAILVSVIMVVGLLPAAAFADTTNYDVWVGGTQVTSDNMDDVLGDGTVKFIPASDGELAQLVLNNATIPGAVGHAGLDTSSVGIEAYIDMEMVLVGNNSVTAHDGENNSIAIHTKNALVISGDGSLTATAAKGKGMHSYGIYTEGTLTIESGNIVAIGQSAKYYSSGICCYEASATINGGSITASGGSGNTGIYGICISNSFDINGGTVTASGKTKAFNQNPNLSAYTDPAVTVNTEAESDGASEWNGATALGGNASPYRYVMIAAEYKILHIAGKGYTAADLAVDIDKIDDEGWSWNAAAQEVTLSGYDSGYIYSKQALTVNLADGTDNTITVPNTANRNGIHTKGKLILTGTGNLAIAVPNTYYDGIWAEDGDVVVDMAGGLTVNAGGQGISVNNGNNNVTLSGDGVVAITAGGEGIYANAGNVTISSAGAVTITAGGDGIYSEAGDVTLSGSGAVTITAAYDDCIEAHNGDVIFSGSGDIEFTAPYGIYTYTDGKNVVINMTGKLTITADYDGILSNGV